MWNGDEREGVVLKVGGMHVMEKEGDDMRRADGVEGVLLLH